MARQWLDVQGKEELLKGLAKQRHNGRSFSPFLQETRPAVILASCLLDLCLR